jgi:hypothetical protein
MNRCAAVLGILLLAGAFGLTASLEGTAERKTASLPSETHALLGTWEALPGGSSWMRLEVQHIHPEWAEVRVSWGKDERAGTGRQMRSRAKVLAGGRLHVSSPFPMTLTLSEDRRALVGAVSGREPGPCPILARTTPDGLMASALPLPSHR